MLDDRLTELHDRITTAVEALVTGDDWQRMLAVAARFHAYSPSNVWAILAANPEATRVCGYQSWRKLGRQVRAGEKGIPILAPVVSRRADADDTTDDTTDGPDGVRRVRGFRIAHVWDVTQTDGADLPDVRPQLLTGDIAGDAWDRVAALIVAEGFTVSRGWCDGANGFTDHTRRQVRVLDTLPPAAAVKTAAHELGHVLMHFDGARLEVDRTRFEIEAESVAYLVMNHLGVDAGAYSFTYLARWSCGDVDRIRQTTATAIACARRIITNLDTNAAADEMGQVAA